MKLYKKLVIVFALLTAAAVLAPSDAQAGPLLDWLRRGCGCKSGCGTPVAPAAYAGMPVAAANPSCGLQP